MLCTTPCDVGVYMTFFFQYIKLKGKGIYFILKEMCHIQVMGICATAFLCVIASS